MAAPRPIPPLPITPSFRASAVRANFHYINFSFSTMPRDKAYFIHTYKHGFINKLTITSKEKPSKCVHSVCSQWQAFISVYYQTKLILCMLLTLEPSKYWLSLQLCLWLFEYVCFHLCQGLLRRKKAAASLWCLPFSRQGNTKSSSALFLLWNPWGWMIG